MPPRLTDGFYSLFSRFNKSKGKKSEDGEGLVQSYDELTLDIADEDLLIMKREWTTLWEGSEAYKRVNSKGDQNERYWLGKQFPDSEYENGKRPLIDNIIFEGLETFLPIAAQKNPEPNVKTENTPQGQKLATEVTGTLSYLAEFLNLKITIKNAVRDWALRFIGCIKIGWDFEENEICIKKVKPQDLILDKDGYVEHARYRGEYLGHKQKDSVRNLIKRFPDKEKEITDIADGKMGSLLGYVEWWTPEFVFWTIKDIVLSKAKNPHWNYDEQKQTVDDFGQPKVQPVIGKNHFKVPRVPFVMLNVFNLGDEPVDKTGLIDQGLVTQDSINKTYKQIDRNADNTNAGAVVSGQFFSKEQAANVAEALREGRTVVVPTGNISEAYKREMGQALPEFVYQTLQDKRERFLSVFGISGSTPSGNENEDTVRGKIIAGNQDSSRIGGGISEYVEQFAEETYNWFVQMMYVYYDQPHFAAIIGANNAQEMISLSQGSFGDMKVVVTVEEGSLIPKNELTERNEAMDLWNADAIDPRRLFERLHDPDPAQAALDLFNWKTNPQAYFGQPPVQIDPNTGQPLQPAPSGGAPTDAGVINAPETPNPASAEAVPQEEHQLIESVPI